MIDNNNSSRKNSGDEDKDKDDGDKSCNEWLPTEEGKDRGVMER